MIYIVEIPHERPPVAWRGYDKESVLSTLYESAFKANSDASIYEEIKGSKFLRELGLNTTDELRQEYEHLKDLADLIDEHGLDRVYYYSYDLGEYTADAVDEFDSYLSWNGHDLNNQLVYMSDEEARKALNDDSVWEIHQGFKARESLDALVPDHE